MSEASPPLSLKDPAIAAIPPADTQPSVAPPADFVWEELLTAMEEGKVVPIVGKDLLMVDTAAGPRAYSEMVAEALAKELKVDFAQFPQAPDVNDVVCASSEFRGDAASVSPKVLRILKTLTVPVPEPLLQLASIRAFPLFVSTTVDTLLERALTQVRGRAPATAAFPPASDLTDFNEGMAQRNDGFVFQLLGRATASSVFALTEGQMLEIMHDLMTGAARPQQLIARLQKSHLLLLGVGFPDWLCLFLIRMGRAKPLWDSWPMRDFIASQGATSGHLSLFLRHFSPKRSHLYAEASPVKFVAELHRRWMERSTVVDPSSSDGDGPIERPAKMEEGAVFISFASEDRNSACRLADALTAQGLDVWIDRRLRTGDEFRDIIARNIRSCCAFVPLLSAHTQTEEPRWFRWEWEKACEQNRLNFGNETRFLHPVVVDATPIRQLREVRQELFGKVVLPVPDGAHPPGNLLEALREAQKAWRRLHMRP